MLNSLIIAVLAFLTTVLQLSFLSQLPFPFSSISFPLLAVSYGIARDRPLLAVGWALVAGAILDLHGLLGFGAELCALFAAFFGARLLFLRVFTNAGTPARFMLAAAAAVIHWSTLAAIDGARILFGAVPILLDFKVASFLTPIRQALVAGSMILAILAVEDALRRRYARTFISHA